MPRVVAPAVTGTVIVPRAGWVTRTVIIGRGLMIISATIVLVRMLAAVVLVRHLRADG